VKIADVECSWPNTNVVCMWREVLLVLVQFCRAPKILQWTTTIGHSTLAAIVTP